MLIIYLVFFYVALEINFKFFKKENNKFIYIVLGLLSPTLLFLHNSFGFNFLEVKQPDRIFVLTFLVSSSLYYLLLIIDDKKEKFVLNRNETLFLALLLIANIWLKFILIIAFSVFGSMNIQLGKIEISRKVIVIFLYIVLLMQTTIQIPVYFHSIVIIFLLGLYSVSRNKKIELFILPLLATLTLIKNEDLVFITVGIYIYTFVAYGKFKLIEDHISSLKEKALSVSCVERLVIISKLKYRKTISVFPSHENWNEEVIQGRQYKKISHESDFKLTFIYLFGLILLIFVLGVR